MLNKVTLIVPTKNRHQFLTRLLEYYQECDLKIIVADTSSEKYSSPVPSNTKYIHYPESQYCEKLNSVFKQVTTPYSVLCADDDFILVNAINDCVQFLEKNSDYHSAQGHYVFYNYYKNKIFYKPAYINTIGADIRSDVPLDRIKAYNNITIQLYYSVHRTNTLKHVFKSAEGKLINLNLVELFIGYATVIHGKHRVLPVFYALRELLYGSAGKSDSINKIVRSDQYKNQYRFFLESLGELLGMNQQNIAKNGVKQIEASVSELIKKRLSRRISFLSIVSSTAKKIVPFSIRRALRFKIMQLLAKKKAKQNAQFAVKYPGFPFKEGNDFDELKKMEALILKHDIIQK